VTISLLNIKLWSGDYELNLEILNEVRTRDSSKRTQDVEEPDEDPILPRKCKYVRFWSKQASYGMEGTLMGRLAEKLIVPELIQQFYEYLSGLAVGSVRLAGVTRFPPHCYTNLTMPVAQFQGKGI